MNSQSAIRCKIHGVTVMQHWRLVLLALADWYHADRDERFRHEVKIGEIITFSEREETQIWIMSGALSAQLTKSALVSTRRNKSWRKCKLILIRVDGITEYSTM